MILGILFGFGGCFEAKLFAISVPVFALGLFLTRRIPAQYPNEGFVIHLHSGQLRLPTENELSLIRRLLGVHHPDAQILKEQLPNLRVRAIDQNGSLAMYVKNNQTPASKTRGVVASGYWETRDGQKTHVLLHVAEGYLNELEIYRDDQKKVEKLPNSEDLVLY